MPEPGESRWSFEKVGMGYRCWSDEIQTELNLVHIKRSRGDLHGELSVKANFAGIKTHNGGIVHVAKLNVGSTTSRSAFAKALEKRTPEKLRPQMDWDDALEALCQGVLMSEQTSVEPVVDFTDAPEPTYKDLFLVEPLILRNQPSLLYGPGGVGKSLVALAAALSVSSGREIVPGMAPAVHANVLYLDWETSPDVMLRRILAIGRGHGFDAKKGFFYRHCSLPLADEVEDLARMIDERHVALIVIDSGAQAQGVQGEYGEASEATIRMHQALRLLKTSALIIDHVSKVDAQGKPGTKGPYGSAYKTNQARLAWEARKGEAETDDQMAVNLYHFKSNDTPQLAPMAVLLDWNEGEIVFHATEPVDEEAKGKPWSQGTRTRILELLEDGEHWSHKAIASALPQIADNTLRKTVSRMIQEGVIWKDDFGNIYRPPLGSAPLRSVPSA